MVGCTHFVWRFTKVYDIVNKSVYQVYSEFGIQNSEFEIQNSELWIVTEMKKWAIWAIVKYIEAYGYFWRGFLFLRC